MFWGLEGEVHTIDGVVKVSEGIATDRRIRWRWQSCRYVGPGLIKSSGRLRDGLWRACAAKAELLDTYRSITWPERRNRSDDSTRTQESSHGVNGVDSASKTLSTKCNASMSIIVQCSIGMIHEGISSLTNCYSRKYPGEMGTRKEVIAFCPSRPIGPANRQTDPGLYSLASTPQDESTTITDGATVLRAPSPDSQPRVQGACCCSCLGRQSSGSD